MSNTWQTLVRIVEDNAIRILLAQAYQRIEALEQQVARLSGNPGLMPPQQEEAS